VILRFEEGAPAAVRNAQMIYIAGWPDAAGWRRILEMLTEQAGLNLMDLPPDLRLRETDSHRFWFNYGPRSVTFHGMTLPAAGVLWESK
jgi:beta-galactosidase